MVQTEQRTGRHVVTVLGACALAGSLAQTMVVPMLPGLPDRLGISATDASWVVTTTLLAGAVSAPLLSTLGDTFGRRRLLLVSLGLLVLGSVVCAFSDSLSVLLVGRTLQGPGMAAIPLGISLARTVRAVRRPAVAISIISAMMGVGGAVGLPLTGLLLELVDYDILFWSVAGTAFLVIGGVLLIVPPDRHTGPHRMDVGGAIQFSALLVALLLALTQGNEWGWTSPATIVTAGSGVVLAVVFILAQLRHANPFIDIRTLLRRPVLLTNTASLLTGYTMFDNFLSTVRIVQAPVGIGLGLGPLAAGLCLLPTGLAMAAVAPLGGRLIELRGARAAMLLGLMVLGAGSLVRVLSGVNLPLIITGSAIVGVGTALAFAAMPALVLAVTPIEHSATAAGLNALSRTLGSVVASASSAALLSALSVEVDGRHLPTGAGFVTTAALSAAATAIAVPLVVATRRRSDAPRACVRPALVPTARDAGGAG